MLYLFVLVFVLLNVALSWFTYDNHSKLSEARAALNDALEKLKKLESDIAAKAPQAPVQAQSHAPVPPRKPKKNKYGYDKIKK